MQKNVIITLVFAIFVALFALLNADKVPVNLVFTEIEISAALVILISACLGAIIVYSLEAVQKIKVKKQCKAAETNLKACQEQLEAMTLENRSLNEKVKRLENPTQKENENKQASNEENK
jgi:uncharacterized integral membrane protein